MEIVARMRELKLVLNEISAVMKVTVFIQKKVLVMNKIYIDK